MKVRLNEASINKKINAVINSPSFRSRVLKAMDRAEALSVVNDLGNELADLIRTAAEESLASTELAAVGEITSGSARKVSDGLYEVYVSIDKQSRPSLAPKVYEPAYDMAGLFNNGWTGGGAWGIWHGERIHGKRVHSPTHFVQDGIKRFWATEGGPYYKVLGIDDVSGRFT